MIDERFYDLKMELAQEANILRNLMNRVMEGEMITQPEMQVINAGVTKAKPIYIAMLEYMIEEPEMDFDEVTVLLEAVDQHDRDTLMAYVNMLTSEKMSVTQKIMDERMQEVERTKSEMMAQVNG